MTDSSCLTVHVMHSEAKTCCQVVIFPCHHFESLEGSSCYVTTTAFAECVKRLLLNAQFFIFTYVEVWMRKWQVCNSVSGCRLWSKIRYNTATSHLEDCFGLKTGSLAVVVFVALTSKAHCIWNTPNLASSVCVWSLYLLEEPDLFPFI